MVNLHNVVQTYAIDTIAQTGRLAVAIIENMAQMTATACTNHFGAYHIMAVIHNLFHFAFIDSFIETGPATAGILRVISAVSILLQ